MERWKDCRTSRPIGWTGSEVHAIPVGAGLASSHRDRIRLEREAIESSGICRTQCIESSNTSSPNPPFTGSGRLVELFARITRTGLAPASRAELISLSESP